MTEPPEELHFELARVLEMRPLSSGEGRCAWSMPIRPLHMNPYGVVHGGLLYTLVDYAMGGALTSVLEAGQRCTTLEIKMNYLAPATEGEVRAEAWVVSKGGRVAVLQANIVAGEKQLAIATGTFYVQGERIGAPPDPPSLDRAR
jgi:acyl-CoA thioesterase